MKAEDTVMTNEQMKPIFMECVNSPTPRNFPLEIAQVQANISFKAGIKEVVDFIGDYTKPFPNQREWKSKLKEWGF